MSQLFESSGDENELDTTGGESSAASKADQPAADENQAETDSSGESEQKEEDGNSDEEGLKEEKQKPPKGVLKRINKLSKQKSEAERERDFWKQEALKAKDGKETVEAPKHKEANGRPKADDFETHEEFQEALTDWKVDQRLKERETKESEKKVKADFDSKVDSYRKSVESIKEKFEDFDDVMESVDDIPMSIALQNLLLESDNGPELAYLLAKDPEEYERISKLSPLSAAREFGKFEARHASKAQKPIKTTKTPPPITTVGSRGASAPKGFRADMTLEEYERWMESQ